MKIKLISMRIAIIVILFATLTSAMIMDSRNDYVKVDTKLYASPYEVTNKEYREFLTALKSTGKDEVYSKCLYDSTQWVQKFPGSFNQPMQDAYHSHPAYNNYPIVNITREAAALYCIWVTEKYNSAAKKKYKKVQFRLPTVTEWKKIAAPLPGHTLPWYGNLPYLSGAENIALANIKVLDYSKGGNNYAFDGGFHTTVVGHYKPNSYGLYDIIGNVSEMTQSDVLLGGSWDNYLDECAIDNSQIYELPDPRVGFRMVMEVIEE